VGAIAMQPRRDPGKQKNALSPHLDHDRCIGCGVCAGACHKDAMEMARDGARPRVPLNSVEKAVRQALERNQLADLLFDAGDGLGSRFLNLAVKAVTSLPPAQRVLAHEQVRSRFVRAALERFRQYA
jgi:ferredoxin